MWQERKRYWPWVAGMSNLLAVTLFIVALFSLLGCMTTYQEEGWLNEVHFGQEPPGELAVLRFHNRTEVPQLAEETRQLFYDFLAARSYHDVELDEIDMALAQLLSQGKQAGQEGYYQELCEMLGADALFTGELLEASKLYLGIYSHLKLRLAVALYDPNHPEPIFWRDTTIHNRHLSPPLSLLSLGGSLFSSLWHLRGEEEMQTQIQLVQRVLQHFPEMLPHETRLIEAIQVEAPERMLRLGDELAVRVQGEEGLRMSVLVLPLKEEVPLQEVAPGEYQGRYRLDEPSEVRFGHVALKLYQPPASPTVQVNMESEYQLDLHPPAVPQISSYTVTRKGIGLMLATTVEKKSKIYVWRSEGDAYELRAVTEKKSFLDKRVRSGAAYWYRLKAVDRAGNESPLGEAMRIEVPSRGPILLRPLGELAHANIRLSSVSNPVLIEERVEVPATCRLYIEPGVRVYLGGGGSLTVKGELIVAGGEDAPVIIEGKGSNEAIVVEGTARIDHAMIRKCGVGVRLMNGELRIAKSSFEKCVYGLVYHPRALLESEDLSFKNTDMKMMRLFSKGSLSVGESG